MVTEHYKQPCNYMKIAMVLGVPLLGYLFWLAALVIELRTDVRWLRRTFDLKPPSEVTRLPFDTPPPN